MSSPQLHFTLIGQWWHLSLETEVSISRAAKRLADEAAGRHDAFAQVRGELREQLVGVGRAARAGGGTDLYVARQLVPGVAIPATMVVYWPRVPRVAAGEPDVRAEAAELASSLRESDARDVAVVDLAEGWGVVRASGVRPERIAADAGGGEVLGASYWVLDPIGSPLALLDFSSPVTSLREPLLEVFDAIVSSLALSPVGPATGIGDSSATG